MIIPSYYKEFLKKRDTFGYLASLNKDLFCDACRSSGAYSPFEEHIKIFYMPVLSPRLSENLRLNPNMAFTMVSALTFESYQMKGQFLENANITPEEEKFKNDYLSGMTAVLNQVGFNLDTCMREKYSKQQVAAIIMKVEEIYEQTPKKGTGNFIQTPNLNP